MIDTRLILIDGLTGAGKSTTAQRLWLHLESLGHPARWLFEDDTSHPLWRQSDPMVGTGVIDPSLLNDLMLPRWRALANEADVASEVVIVECAVTLAGRLAVTGMPIQAIEAHVRAVEPVIARLKPVLIYLRQSDVARSLRNVCRNRASDPRDYEAALIESVGKMRSGKAGAVTDFAGLVEFHDVWRNAIDRLVAALSIPTLVIDVGGDGWRARERQLTDFLQLPAMGTIDMHVDRPSRFTGRYRDNRSSDELVVEGNEHGLYFDDARRTRLIPAHNGAFHLTATCAQASFGDESEGAFQRMELRGHLAGLSPVWIRTQDSGDADGAHRHEGLKE